MRRVVLPSVATWMVDLAARASRLIVLRTSDTTLRLPSGAASTGRMSSRTTESAVPRISTTASSTRQPSTSVIAASPCATPRMRSPALSCPERIAGPPGTRSRMVM